MSGICGVFNRAGAAKNNNIKIEVMANTLGNRGPDSNYVYNSGVIKMGFRGLGKRKYDPFNNKQNSFVILDGRISNEKALCRNLGIDFGRLTNEELIAITYEKYDIEFIKKISGPFALAIWDREKERLILGRDRLGEKPLYYYEDNDILIFSSTIKTILKSGIINPKVNLPILDFYLTLGYVPAPETLITGIRKLLPANILLVERSSYSNTFEYWRLEDFVVEDAPVEENVHKLRQLMFNSTENRIEGIDNIGMFLSGGLDSSSVLACFKAVSKKNIKTFSVGYENAEAYSEVYYSRLLTNKFKTDHLEYILTPESFFASLNEFIEHIEEPVVEGAGIAMLHLARLAKLKGVSLLLSGEGGDEAFGGYPMYLKMKKIEKISSLMHLFGNQSRIISKLFGISEKHKKYIDWIFLPFKKRYLTVSSDLTRSIKKKMYSRHLMETLDGRLEQFFLKLYQRVSDKSMLSKMQYVDMKTWLPDDLLIKGDKMTMAESVDVSAPILDQSVIEFAARLPESQKLSGKKGKFILKTAMKTFLPKEILNREKKGFPIPVSLWLKNELSGKVEAILTENRTVDRGYFNNAYVKDILHKHKVGKEDLGRRILSLLILELWHRKYID